LELIMSVMFTDTEVRTLNYQASRMELVRVTTGPSYDTVSSYVGEVASQAVLQATTQRELGIVVAVMRRWLGSCGDEVERRKFDAIVAAGPFPPDPWSQALAYG